MMTFHSILSPQPLHVEAGEPDFFGDLNLDQVVAAVVAGRAQYDLTSFFHTPLHDVDTIRYRHEIMRDLEEEQLLAAITAFARDMRSVRDHLTTVSKLHHRLQKDAWFRDAVEIYCAAVRRLADDLATADLKSRGFAGLGDFTAAYVQSEQFVSLSAQARQLKAALADVAYSIHIKNGRVTVRNYQADPDYSVEVAATFDKFKQGTVKKRVFKFRDSVDMNHVETRVVELVAKLYEDTFATLAAFRARNADFVDETIRSFDREVQFYLAYGEYAEALKRQGLAFCYPEVQADTKDVLSKQGFDIALAAKLAAEREQVVTNDFHLAGDERVLVVSGPNQGGKTTFARTFGQLHYLASLGLPVPGTEARLTLFDRLFTHFEREENIANHRGKLQDDLVRIHAILTKATPDSIIIMNEIFTSTALEDALFLSTEIITRIMQLDVLCVCVTFIDELASLGPQTVSMVSTVVPDNPAVRTFKIVRRPADGLAYAMSVAQKYGLTYRRLRERMAS